MVNALKKLVQLQQIDGKLDEIEHARGDLPLRVKAAEEKLAAVKVEIEQHAATLKTLQKDKMRLESEITALNARKKQNEERLYAVTTNKEYDAVTLEIESVMQHIDEAETHLLETIEQEETTQEKLTEQKENLERLEAAHAVQSADLSKRIARNADREAKLKAEREALVKEIPIQHVRLYERIRPSKDGLAIVSVVRGACGGCFTQIPPQRVMEVRDQDKFIACESCGRILYWKEQPEQIADPS